MVGWLSLFQEGPPWPRYGEWLTLFLALDPAMMKFSAKARVTEFPAAARNCFDFAQRALVLHSRWERLRRRGAGERDGVRQRFIVVAAEVRRVGRV